MSKESQASAASEPARALTDRLMEEVCRLSNLSEAYYRVVSNKGKPVIDGMTVDDLSPWLGEHRQTRVSSLLDGMSRPGPVLGGKIPKTGSGERQLVVEIEAPYGSGSYFTVCRGRAAWVAAP